MTRARTAAFLYLCAAAAAAAAWGAGGRVRVRLEVSDVRPEGGTVFLAVYDCADGYRRKAPAAAYSLKPEEASAGFSLDLPPGEYVFVLFQDLDGDSQLDTNFLGMPREPVGITNRDGRKRPRSFRRQKIRVEFEGQVLTVRLVSIRR